MERIAEEPYEEEENGPPAAAVQKPPPLPFLNQSNFRPTTFNNNAPSSPDRALRSPSLKQRPPESPSSAFPPNHPLAGLPYPNNNALQLQQYQASRLQYYHTRPPVYVAKPSFGLKDFELLDTLGK